MPAERVDPASAGIGSRSGLTLAYPSHLVTASVTLWPPKPNEFERATSTLRSTFLLGAQFRSQSGSGVIWLIVGGMTPQVAASSDTPNSSAPAPPSRWPVIDLVDPNTSALAWSPKTALTASVSATSPCSVDVPCALIYPTSFGSIRPSARQARMARWAPSPCSAGDVI